MRSAPCWLRSSARIRSFGQDLEHAPRADKYAEQWLRGILGLCDLNPNLTLNLTRGEQQLEYNLVDKVSCMARGVFFVEGARRNLRSKLKVAPLVASTFQELEKKFA